MTRTQKKLLPSLLLVAACSDGGIGSQTGATVEYPSNSSYPADYAVNPNTGAHYEGGPILSGTPKVHVVFYANVPTARRNAIDSFVDHLSGSPLLDVLTTYADGNNNRFSGQLDVGLPVTIPSRISGVSGDAEFDAAARAAALATGEPDAFYLLVAGTSVPEPSGRKASGFCAWHTTTTDSFGRTLVYGAVIESSNMPSSCTENGPSGDGVLDIMVDMAWHETAESITDPTTPDAYEDPEIGDMCESSRKTDDGSLMAPGFAQHTKNYPAGFGFANVRIGYDDFLVQPIWQNVAGGGCVWRLALQKPSVSLNSAVATGSFGAFTQFGNLLVDEAGALSEYTLGANGTAYGPYAIDSLNPSQKIYGMADFDGDTTTDLVIRNLNTGRISIWTMLGGTVTAKHILGADGAVPIQQEIAAVGDFNGDGLADILFQNTGTMDTWLWQNPGSLDGTANFSSLMYVMPSIPMGANMDVVGVGDFRNVGHAEVLWKSMDAGADDATFSIWDPYPNGSTASYVSTTVDGSQFRHRNVLGVADLNGDGIAEIVAGQNGSSYLFSVDARTGVATPVSTTVPLPDAPWQYAGASICPTSHDTTHGGRMPCITWRDRQNGTVSTWLLDWGTGTLAYSSIHPVTLTPNQQVVAP